MSNILFTSLRDERVKSVQGRVCMLIEQVIVVFMMARCYKHYINHCWIIDEFLYNSTRKLSKNECLNQWISVDLYDVIKWKNLLCYWPFTPVTWSFDIFSDLGLSKRLDKHSRRRSFETPSRLLWRHCNVYRTPGQNTWSGRHNFRQFPPEYSQ